MEKPAQTDQLSTGSWRLTCAECALSWAAERRTRWGRHSHSRWAQWGMRWQSDGLESRGQPWVLRGNSHRPMTRRHLKGPLPREGWHVAYLHTPSLEGEEKTTTYGHIMWHSVNFITPNLCIITYLLLMYNLIAEQLQKDTTINLCIDKDTWDVHINVTHHWWGWSLYPLGDPAGSPQRTCSLGWCGQSLWKWLLHTLHTLPGSLVEAPQTPSRNEPAHHPCCCYWVRKTDLMFKKKKKQGVLLIHKLFFA